MFYISDSEGFRIVNRMNKYSLGHGKRESICSSDSGWKRIFSTASSQVCGNIYQSPPITTLGKMKDCERLASFCPEAGFLWYFIKLKNVEFITWAGKSRYTGLALANVKGWFIQCEAACKKNRLYPHCQSALGFPWQMYWTKRQVREINSINFSKSLDIC